MDERFIIDDAGTLIDILTRDTFDYVSDVCPVINKLWMQTQRFEKHNQELENENEELKSDFLNRKRFVPYEKKIERLKLQNKDLLTANATIRQENEQLKRKMNYTRIVIRNNLPKEMVCRVEKGLQKMENELKGDVLMTEKVIETTYGWYMKNDKEPVELDDIVGLIKTDEPTDSVQLKKEAQLSICEKRIIELRKENEQLKQEIKKLQEFQERVYNVSFGKGDEE